MPSPAARALRRSRPSRPSGAARPSRRSHGPARIVRWALALGALLALCTGCSTDLVVRVDAREDGSGAVRVTAVLDKAAAARTGGVAEALRVDDLRAAGWTVTIAPPTAAGSVTVTALHPFADPAQAGAVLAQLSGPDGPLRGFRVERSSRMVATTTRFSGTVDLTDGMGVFGDAALQQALAGPTRIGVDDAELRRQWGVDPKDALHVAVEADLPGAAVQRWTVALGQRRTLTTSATLWLSDVLVPLGVGVVAAVLLLTLWVRGRRHGGLRPSSGRSRRRPDGLLGPRRGLRPLDDEEGGEPGQGSALVRVRRREPGDRGRPAERGGADVPMAPEAARAPRPPRPAGPPAGARRPRPPHPPRPQGPEDRAARPAPDGAVGADRPRRPVPPDPRLAARPRPPASAPPAGDGSDGVRPRRPPRPRPPEAGDDRAPATATAGTRRGTGRPPSPPANPSRRTEGEGRP